MVGPVNEISFTETGTGHVSYMPTSEMQHIDLVKSGYLISKLPVFPRISCSKTAIVPGGTTRPPFS